MKRFSQLTSAQWTAMKIAGAKVLVVDGTIGADSGSSVGLRGAPVRAFRTLTAAKAAAQSGDKIVVMPGTYTENNLLKNGVNWHFMPGAVVSYINTVVTGSSTVYGIFDDRDGACTCQITGDGEFYFEAGFNEGVSNTTIKGGIYISNAASSIRIQGRSINFKAHFGDITVYAIRIEDCTKVVIDVPEILDIGFGVVLGALPSTACGILFRWGQVFITTNRIKMGLHAVHALQKTSPSGKAQLHVKAGQIEGDPLASGTFNNIWIDGGTVADFKTFIDCEYGIPGESDFCVINGGGEHSIRVKRITTAAGSAIFNVASDATGTYNPKATLWAGHIETGEYAVLCGINAVGSPKVTAVFERVESTNHFARCLAGELLIMGGLFRSIAGGSNIFGISHEGGVMRLQGVTVDTSPLTGASSWAVKASASGLILDGCKMIAPAGSNGIGGGTATVKVYGQSFTNPDKAGTITVTVGTLTFSSSLT